MKKALLIIGILSVIFLTGCSGIFNLNGFIVPEPGKAEFMTIVEKLDTPQKISDYMLENFTYQKHTFYAPSPYQLWLTKNGDCNDMSTFGVFMADYHGYETYQIQIFYKGTLWRHCIAVYVEEGGMSFTDNWYYFNNWGDWFETFKEIVEFDCKYFLGKELKKYIVKDYENNIVKVGYNYVH